MKTYDFAIIGGGIVGLATAYSLQKKSPGCRVVVLEKEESLARHQTGHNSGVIHSGIYYRPGSFKAKMAKNGCEGMLRFCEENGIPSERCGKVIVATDKAELPRLDQLLERGFQNGLKVSRLSGEQVSEIEPHVQANGGIRVPTTGITDYKAVCVRLGELIEDFDGEIRLRARVLGTQSESNEWTVMTTGGEVRAKVLINCSGLHSDRVAKSCGCDPEARIVPFRGEYYELVPEKRYLVKGLIYPVPNPSFPFLGVHFTRMVDGSVHAGPNAVLSYKREGYTKTDFCAQDLAEVLTFGGFWKLAMKHFGDGWAEIVRSYSKKIFVESLQRLIPELTINDVVPTHAGVRAQALLPNGQLVDDFLIVDQDNAFHVCNAPSPAATASLEIGKYISERVISSVKLDSKKSIAVK